MFFLFFEDNPLIPLSIIYHELIDILDNMNLTTNSPTNFNKKPLCFDLNYAIYE